MTAEEFLAFLRKTKFLIDDAIPCQGEVGIGTFLTYYDKYKHIIFKGYTQECLESKSFKDYVWHMMCMTVRLDKENKVEEIPLEASNVVDFYDYL